MIIVAVLWLSLMVGAVLSLPSSAVHNPEKGQAAPLEDGATIRVLVVYTRAARVAAGSVSAIESHIQEAVRRTNQSYQDSGIAQSLVLAGSREIVYSESGDLGTDLMALGNAAHPELGVVHTWRNQDFADLVSLVVSNGTPCYQSYQMTEVSHGFEQYAFSVVRWDCMISELGFPMALGHNMGARLDWFEDDQQTPYTYSHGYVNWEQRWRTVMTTEELCRIKGVDCEHLWLWSNPEKTFQESPLGFPEGTSVKCDMRVENNPDCDADNARVLSHTSSVVAGFRPDPPPDPTSTPTPTSTPSILLVNDEGQTTPEVEHYYVGPLQTLQAPFDTWRTGSPGYDEPKAADLASYRSVIWFTGRNVSEFTGPEPTTEAILQQWLAQEKCFLIFSQDYYQPNEAEQPTLLMRNELGVLSVTEDVGQTVVSGRGPFGALGSLNLVEPTEYPIGWNFSDAMQPAPGAVVAFDGDLGPAGLFKMTSSYRTSYLAFPLEMIPSESDRIALLNRFLQTCQFWETFLPVIIKP